MYKIIEDNRRLQAKRSSSETNPLVKGLKSMLNQQSQICINDSVQENLIAAAIELQAQYATESGVVYNASDLKAAARKWLESSIEQLAEDAVFHLKEGRADFTFNRSTFDRELAKLSAIEVSGVQEPVAA